MIILDIPQQSEEWFSARCGIPSASNFKKIITSTGKPSTQAKKYMYQLAGERLLGRKEETYSNYHMERGNALEGEARLYYELITNKEVEQVGLVYKDERKLYSCSPDGMGLEIKCPSLAVHTEYLDGGKIPTDHVAQVQGCMYVTGYESWDFLSYYPGMKHLLVTVERDEEFMKILDELLEKFCANLEKVSKRLQEKTL